ncbi:transposable element Tc1 transposase [Trichonephila clavipes]|nr:transposable element Tc1 transposase [Trichonephila clavipes]
MPGCRQRRHFQQTDDFTRGMVIGLKREGWSFRQIAADTNRDESTEHRLWRRWLAQGNVARSRGPGAARAREDRHIHNQAVAAPQATSTSILQHVEDTLVVPISTRTIFPSIGRKWPALTASAQNTSIDSTA